MYGVHLFLCGYVHTYVCVRVRIHVSIVHVLCAMCMHISVRVVCVHV